MEGGYGCKGYHLRRSLPFFAPKEEKGSFHPIAEKEKNTEAIYDARTLGTPKMLVLGIQHLFAMFGATVLVPALTGLNVSTTLLFAGWVHCCST